MGLEDMVKEGFSEMLMFRQCPKNIERTSWWKSAGKLGGRARTKTTGLTVWLVPSREVR